MGQVYGNVICNQCNLSNTKLRFTNVYTGGSVDVPVRNRSLMGYVAVSYTHLTLPTN